MNVDRVVNAKLDDNRILLINPRGGLHITEIYSLTPWSQCESGGKEIHHSDGTHTLLRILVDCRRDCESRRNPLTRIPRVNNHFHIVLHSRHRNWLG